MRVQTLFLLALLGPAVFSLLNATTLHLPKAAVKLEPPWIQVLKEDTVTLTCEGTNGTKNSSVQWTHNKTITWQQSQANYTFTAKLNDTGDYQCKTNGTSLSDPVHLEVISDWLLLQTPQLVFEEGETITLRCHSWKNKQLTKVLLFHNGTTVKYSGRNSTFMILHANQSHSGNWSCKGSLGKTPHQSKNVTLIVEAHKHGNGFPFLTLLLTVALLALVVVIVIILICFLIHRRPRHGRDGRDTVYLNLLS